MDLETGNVVRAYASEAAALRDVVATVRRLGPEAVADLALGEGDHPPGGTALAGQELVEHALATGALKNGRPRARRRPAVSANSAAGPPARRTASKDAGRRAHETGDKEQGTDRPSGGSSNLPIPSSRSDL